MLDRVIQPMNLSGLRSGKLVCQDNRRPETALLPNSIVLKVAIEVGIVKVKLRPISVTILATGRCSNCSWLVLAQRGSRYVAETQQDPAVYSDRRLVGKQ